MAIRINAGAAPRLGRISQPLGTFLPNDQPPYSNPSTGAAGSLGGSMGMNPGGPRPGGPTSEVVPMGFLDVVRAILGVPQPGTVQLSQSVPYVPKSTGTGQPTVNAYTRGPRPGGPTSPARSIGFLNTVRSVLAVENQPEYQFQTQGVPFEQITNPRPTHPFVGQGISSRPAVVSMSQARALYPGEYERTIQMMAQKHGYKLVSEPGVGSYFVKSSPATPSNENTPIEQRAGQQYQAATQTTTRQPGDTFVDESGIVYRMGEPAPDGQLQYSMTIPGGQDDERYKWESKVKRDEDGNWVRVYKRAARAQYSRNWRKKQQQRREERQAVQAAQAAVPSQSVVQPQAYNQLVNLRVNFG